MLYFTQSIVQFFFTLVFISIPIKLYIQLEFHLFELERKKKVLNKVFAFQSHKICANALCTTMKWKVSGRVELFFKYLFFVSAEIIWTIFARG